MADVNADPADVRKLAKALERYQADVRQAAKSAAGAVAGAKWNDPQKAKFEARLRDHQRQLERFVSADVEHMVRSLNQLAGKLEEIKRMRL